MIDHVINKTVRQTESRDHLTYREVTLSMPVLRSSSVQAVSTVLTSMLPLFRIFPEVFSKCRANSPSLRSCWFWRSEDWEQGQQSGRITNTHLLTPTTGRIASPRYQFLFTSLLFLTDLFGVEVQNQTKRLDVEVKLDSLQSFIILFTVAHSHLSRTT